MFAQVLVVLALFESIHGGDFNGPGLYQITQPLEHTECPSWDGRKNLLYFVDIHIGKIYSYNYNTKAINSITLNGEVAPVVQSQSNPNSLIIGLNRSIIELIWDGKSQMVSQTILATVANDKPTSRINDGKADSKGRIWFGTMGYESVDGQLSPNDGALYRLQKNGHPVAVVAPVNISNGLVWNKANDRFYYIDSPSLQVAEYHFNSETGEISNRRVAFDLKANKLNAHPDGMTIDKDDNLYIALYGGGSVIKVDPIAGELLQQVPIPASCVTSVMWGGPNLDILFVTTSRYSLTEAEKAKEPGAGSVFALTNLQTAGLPVYIADII